MATSFGKLKPGPRQRPERVDAEEGAQGSKGSEPSGRLSRHLTQREQALLDIVARRGEMTAADLEDALKGRLHNSTIRTHLRSLVAKGHLRYTDDAGRFVYSLSQSKVRAAGESLRQFVLQFFGGKTSSVFAELIPLVESEQELDEIAALIEEARRQQRHKKSPV